jgi:hypothetical protein
VRVLSYRVELVLDERGAVTRTHHRRYRIERAEAKASDWAETGAFFSPWHEDRPEITAVVETARGVRVALDPKTIEEASAADGDGSMYSDRRRLRAPLPAIDVGSIVEETIVTRSRPLSPGAAGGFEVLGDAVGADAIEIVLDAPTSLPLRWKLGGDDGGAHDEVKGGRRRIVVRRMGYERTARTEPYLPDGVPYAAHFRYATGRAWGDLAAHYAEIVDKQLASAKGVLTSKAKGLVGKSDSVDAKVRALTAFVRREVRYTGLELGEGAIVPRTPAETLDRRYGDCKDQATLLVGLLREVGVDAHVALVRVGGIDADPDLPSLDAFNHAVVAVGGGARTTWVDPTATMQQAGELSPEAEGRQALIASRSTTRLHTTPVSDASKNVYRETREVWLPEDGRPRLVEVASGTGVVEALLRAEYAKPENAKREAAERYVTNAYGASKLGEFRLTRPDELSVPFVLRFEALDSVRGAAGEDSAEFIVEDGALFAYLPSSLLEDETRTIGAKFPFAHRSELEVTVHAHEAFEASEPPPASVVELGPARLTRAFERKDARTVIARYAFELPKRDLSVDELAALRGALGRYRQAPAVRVRFDSRLAAVEARGDAISALTMARDLAERPHASFAAGRRYARALLRSGLVGEAQRVARGLGKAHPQRVDAALFEAALESMDPLGRDFAGGIDTAAAERALDRALALDPKNAAAFGQKAGLAGRDAHGRPTLNRARQERARAALEGWERHAPEERRRGDFSLPLTLLRLGDAKALRSALESRSDHENAPDYRLALAAFEKGQAGVKAALEELRVAPKDRAATLERAAYTAYAAGAFEAVRALRGLRHSLAQESEASFRLYQQIGATDPKEPAEARAVRAFIAEGFLFAATGRKRDGSTAASLAEQAMAARVREKVEWLRNAATTVPIEAAWALLVAMTDATVVETRNGFSVVDARLEGAPFERFVVHTASQASKASERKVTVLGGVRFPDPVFARTIKDAFGDDATRARVALDLYLRDEESDGAVPTRTAGSTVWRETGDPKLTLEAMSVDADGAAIERLEAARARATSRPLQVALDSALLTRRLAAEAPVVDAVIARLRAAGGSTAILRSAEVAAHAKRGDLARIHVLLADGSVPDSAKARAYGAAANMLCATERVADGFALFVRAESLAPLDTDNANNAAWCGLLAGRADDAVTKKLIERLAGTTDVHSLHTVASVRAANGDVTQARAAFEAMRGALGPRPIRPSHLLPAALLAERHGLPDEARRLFEAVSKQDDDPRLVSFVRARIERLRSEGRGQATKR